MLWYPVVYICLILPITICRMAELRHKNAPPALIFTAMTLLFLVGLSNVAIYVSTRNVGFRRREPTSTASQPGPNAQGTQVEVYIDRVTRHDGGIVMFGGSRLVGDIGSSLHVEDLEMGGKKYDGKGGDTSSSRDSLSHEPMDTTRPSTPYADPSLSSIDKGNSSKSPITQAIALPQRALSTKKNTGPIFVDRVGHAPIQSTVAPFNDILIESETNPSPNASLGRRDGSNRIVGSTRRSILSPSRSFTQSSPQNMPEQGSNSFSWHPYGRASGNT
ncbi:hypothetical protein FRC17_007324 [Serendipita sp. 399]|nr:hypothetical protein FRC17_007324 [Serendipita sp. 399]